MVVKEISNLELMKRQRKVIDIEGFPALVNVMLVKLQAATCGEAANIMTLRN